MSAAIGAALAGARTMTATSSQGLALMAEVVYIAAAMRAPIVMALGNRALSGPINIHCDHSDSMLIRDSGVVQLFAENAQEAYDLTVIAPRLAEHPDVLLPVLVCQDGFTITHSAEPVELLADEDVRGSSATTRSRIRCSTPRSRRRRARSRCRTTTSSCGASRSRALEAALEAFAERRGRVRAALGPLVRPGRGVPARRRGARARRARLVGRDDQGRRRRAARRGRAGRAAQDRLLPAVPGRGGSRALLGRRRLRDRPRPGRLAGRRRRHSYAELAAALYRRGAELRGHVYGLGGRDLHPEDLRAVFAGASAATSDCEVRRVPPEDTRPQRGRRAAARRRPLSLPGMRDPARRPHGPEHVRRSRWSSSTRPAASRSRRRASPTTAWNVPWLHVAFENAAAVASGVESAQRALRRRHALPAGRGSQSSSSPATAARTTSACRRSRARSSAAIASCSSATTTRPT